mmetsp:Transcript_91568/g.158769  ORF Transcript_91568/g.158769 Transcript_91568/m.158769 type:complete len:438 (-) Transcript_91568:1274-2587(-)
MPLFVAPLLKSAMAAGIGLGLAQHSLLVVKQGPGAIQCPHIKSPGTTPRPTQPPGVHTPPRAADSKADRGGSSQTQTPVSWAITGALVTPLLTAPLLMIKNFQGLQTVVQVATGTALAEVMLVPLAYATYTTLPQYLPHVLACGGATAAVIPSGAQLSSVPVGIAMATGVGTAFVLSMWFVPGARGPNRDDPGTIQKRFACVLGVSAAAMVIVACVQPSGSVPALARASQAATPLKRMGLTCRPFLADVAFTMGLNSLLFLGPMIQSYYRGDPSSGPGTEENRLQSIRDLFVGPVTEEIVYRVAACYCLYFAGMSRTGTLLLSSTLFSLAHGHHLLESVYLNGVPLSKALAPVSFQLAFTYVFGMYAAYIYMGTGSLLSAIALHSYCNYMGPPSFDFIGTPQQNVVGTAYVTGLVAFFSIILGFNQGNWTQSIFYMQ